MMPCEWNSYKDVKSETAHLYDSGQPVQSAEVLQLKKQNEILKAKIENLQLYLEAREAMTGQVPKASVGLLLDAIAVPAVLTESPSEKIVAANNVFHHLFGVTRKDTAGKSLLDLSSLVSCQPHVHDLGRLINNGPLLNQKMHLKTADGQILCLTARSKALKINEKTCCLTLFVEDGTPERQSQSSEPGKTLFHSIAKNFPNGLVAVFDQKLRIMFAEGAALKTLGLRRKQFEGKLITELDEDITNLLRSRCQQVLSGKSVRYETAFRGRFFLSTYLPIFDKTGQLKLGMIIATDITRLKQTEQALRKTRRDMENRVRERTAELKVRNNRLLHLSKELKNLARKTISVMENDRKAMAIELHDRIGGTLAAIIFQLEGRVSEMNQPPPAGEMPLERTIAHLHEMIYETRRIAKQLRPSVLDDFGLFSAIEEAIADFKEFFPRIHVIPNINFTEESMTDEVKIVLYRVIQEAFNNAGRHSDARQVTISMFIRDKIIYLAIKDDGCGFKLSEIPLKLDPLRGYGIHSMKDRVELCKGRFHIYASPGNGTCIEVSIPVKPEEV